MRRKIDNEVVYVFDKKVDESLVYEETKRFLDEHDIETYEDF